MGNTGNNKVLYIEGTPDDDAVTIDISDLLVDDEQRVIYYNGYGQTMINGGDQLRIIGNNR
jgi:hypothetical protein